MKAVQNEQSKYGATRVNTPTPLGKLEQEGQRWRKSAEGWHPEEPEALKQNGRQWHH